MNTMHRTFILLNTIFAILTILSNLVAEKFVYINLWFIHTTLSAGSLFYPFCYLISDLISEFYGKQAAKSCLRNAIIMNIIAVSMLYLIELLPATEWSVISNQDFINVMSHYRKIFIGSMIAVYISQNFDIIFYMWFKRLTQSRLIWLRSGVCTFCSLVLDNFIIVMFMVYIGLIPYKAVSEILFNTIVFKICFSFISMPVFYILVKILNQHIIRTDKINLK